MKILGLDLGDKWVGVAISDPIGIVCKPLKTVSIDDLDPFLKELLPTEEITKVVVGYPKTMSGGTESEQTKKIVNHKKQLEHTFACVNGRLITWVLWDERLSSKRAEQLKKRAKTKEEKRQRHAIAASFVLQSYLDYCAFQASV